MGLTDKEEKKINKSLKKSMLPILAMTAMTSMMFEDHSYMEHSSSKNHEPSVLLAMPVPRVKTEDEIKRKKEHRKQLKARRNARKGIYSNKISYKKKRNKNE